MKKKYLKTAACVAAMALAMLSHAHPAHAAGTQGVPVTVSYAETQKARAPSVMIPREIYLKDETQCSYEVWAYCPSNELDALFDSVAVTPSESFTLTNERTGATFTGSATQDKTEFLPDDVKGGEACEVGGVQAMKAAAQGSISVDGIPQGRWTGAVVFTVDEIPHNHAWTMPVLSDDKLTVTCYACPCGERTSHLCLWDIVHKVESGFSAGAVKYWECSTCGETIDPGSHEELVKANNAASEAIKQAWVAKNITANMTELEKVKAILNELHFWHYGSVPGLPTNISRTTMCGGANKAFVEYCAAVGIRAEQVDASKELHVPDHYIAYVWIDGEQYVADATPESHGLMGTQDIIWTMEGFDLYLDYLDGTVTEEEFDQYMPGYEK